MLRQRRFLCTKNSHFQWPIKQVTKTNFKESLEEIETHIFNCDYIAISLRKTGAYSSPWQKVLPIDTAETAYLKAKRTAERFQILQFAVCPSSVKSSKLIAHPYNFHLFPRDELKLGMPSHSFSCQSSYLTSMAAEGFDFNACIDGGISYVSRAQESVAKNRVGNPIPGSYTMPSPSTLSIADSVFLERIKSRVRLWMNACKDPRGKSTDALISSLRKIVAGSEVYGSRPCLSIDVCSERQVQLVLEMLKGFADVVPLLVPDKSGGVEAVRVVLTRSKEDKNLLEEEIRRKEAEDSRQIRGFGEVIELISTSQKPVVAHNALNDFTILHSKFLAALPPTECEFRSSLHLVFPQILDLNHLMKDIGLVKKVNSLPFALYYLKRKSFMPMELEIPNREAGKVKVHGHNVLKISELFAKLCSIAKNMPENCGSADSQMSSVLGRHSNMFSTCSTASGEHTEEDVRPWSSNGRGISTENLVFLWGLGGVTSARKLKELLCSSNELFSSEEFDVRMVDKSCAVVVFGTPGCSERFLRKMDSGGISCEPLKDMMSQGLTVAGYGTYKNACKLGLWEANLADTLDRALEQTESLSEAKSTEEQSVVDWNNDEIINLDEL